MSAPEESLRENDLALRLWEAENAPDAGGGVASARVEACCDALRETTAFLHPREGGDAVVETARLRFGSPAAFFEAPKQVLESVGIPAREALLFSQIPALTRYVRRNRFGERPRIRRVGEAEAFLQTRYLGLSIEHFYLLCPDASGRMIDCALLQSGTTDSAPFYLKHVLMEIVRTRARAVVVSHNHPSFSPRPSQADINCTLDLMGAVRAIGTVLLDHIIVSDKECLSLREAGYLRAHLWIGQAPEDPLLRGWLEKEKK